MIGLFRTVGPVKGLSMMSGISGVGMAALTIVLATGLVALDPAWAVKFPPTGGRGAPGRTAGGGTRGPVCVTDPRPLTVLMPENGVHSFVGPGLSLLAYVPQTRAKRLEFRLLDDRNKLIQRVDLSSQLGRSGVQLLPVTGVTVEADRGYRWVLSLVCDPLDRSADIWVRGELRRRVLGEAVRSRLVGKAPLVRAGLLAEGLFWQETVVELLGVRSRNPGDWRELLGSVGLGDWGAVPVVDGVLSGAKPELKPTPKPTPRPTLKP